MSLFDFKESQGEARDNSSQPSRDRGAQGDTANWSGRLCAQTGLLGQEQMRQGLELRLYEDKAPPSPWDKEENEISADFRGTQEDIAAKLDKEREAAGRRQGALQGPPCIERRHIAGPRTVAQGRAPATVAQGQAPRQARMSGFQQALEKLKGRLANDVVIKQELDWQHNVKNDRTKQAAFKDKARAQQTFSACLVMQPQSGYLTCIHSAHVYHSLAAVPTENDGEFIQFIGNRTPTRFPILIKLLPLASFEWKQVDAVNNPNGLDDKYKDQPPGQLWVPDATKQRTQFIILRLLALPTIGFKIFLSLGSKVMPHE
jgi:hypothetical protein